MPVSQANVEYFFRLLYDLFAGKGSSYAVFGAFLAHLWTWVIVIGYVIALFGLVVIVYSLVRLFELREREEHFYDQVIVAPESKSGVNARWEHIESLAGGASASEWKEAILEADIMLDDMLKRMGYAGDGVGERLKQVDQASFATLSDAWEAHKVRNQIAHEGPSFALSQALTQRTLNRYRAVFREFDLIPG